jgi:uncharacterized membrane protein YgcG
MGLPLLCVETDTYGAYCTYKGCTTTEGSTHACPSDTTGGSGTDPKWRCIVPQGHTSHYCFRDYNPAAGGGSSPNTPSPADPEPPEPTPDPERDNGDSSCVGWRQTGGCVPWGKREADKDLECTSVIQKYSSGYCECGGGTTAAQVGCGHSTFTCVAACKSIAYEVPLLESAADKSPWSSSSCGACGADKYDPDDEETSGQGSTCIPYSEGHEPDAGSLTGTCKCGSGYRGIGCTIPLANSVEHTSYGAASSFFSIPLKARIPVTVKGVQYQSVVEAYLRSLARDLIIEVSKNLMIAPGRMDADSTIAVDAKGQSTPSSYLSWIDGTTINIPLTIHSPIDMSDSVNKAIGTTEEMNALAQSVEKAFKNPWSSLRKKSTILSTLSASACCGRVLLSAPSLNFNPSSITFNIDVSKMEKYVGYETKEISMDNTVSGSNPAVVQSITLTTPIAPWVSLETQFKLPASIEYETPMKLMIKVDRKIISTMPAGSYFQVVEVQHHLLDMSPHNVQVRLEISGGSGSGSGGSSGSGSDVRPNSGTNHNNSSSGGGMNPEQIVNEPGFLPGVVLGATTLFVIVLVCLLVKRCCCGCCTGDRRAQLQKANKKKGTPSTKFSKIQFEDDDDVDDLDGLELARVGSKSSSKSNMNDFGIIRSGTLPLRPSNSSGGGGSSGGGSNIATSSSTSSATIHLVSGVTLDANDFEPTWQSMDLTKLWGSTLKSLPTEQEWEDLLAADSILCMASGQVDDTQKFYFYATDDKRRLYLVEASITKSSKRLACVFKTSSEKGASMLELESFIGFFRNRIVGYLTRL